MLEPYQERVHQLLENFSIALQNYNVRLGHTRAARIALFGALEALYVQVAIPMADGNDVQAVALRKRGLGWRGNPSYPHNEEAFGHALGRPTVSQFAAFLGLNLWIPEHGVAPPTLAEEIAVYELLAHFIDAMADLIQRVQEEQLAMDAITKAAAHFSDIHIIPVCTFRDVRSVATLVMEAGWPGKLMHATAPALLQHPHAQPLAALRAAAAQLNLEIQYAG